MPKISALVTRRNKFPKKAAKSCQGHKLRRNTLKELAKRMAMVLIINVLVMVKTENVPLIMILEISRTTKELTPNKPLCSRERNIVEKH